MPEHASPFVINPQEIASYLGSSAEPRQDRILRDIQSQEIVTRLKCWEIFLISPLNLRETSMHLVPDVNEVFIEVKHPHPEQGHAFIGATTRESTDIAKHSEVRMVGVTEVRFQPAARWVEFVQESDDWIATLSINRCGMPRSDSRLKTTDSGLYIDSADYFNK